MSGIVAAIDLGTSRTAYSYTVLGDEDGDKPRVLIGVPDKLGDATVAPERKTATSLLLKKSDEHPEGWRLQTFGDRAEREYLDARTNHQGKDLALFKHFKMELFQGGRDRKGGREVDDVMGIATDNVVKLPLVYIVSLALGDIMKQIVKRLNNSDQVTLRSTDIRWVLTVPAVWSNFGKRFMRAAAYKGGLIKFEDDQEMLTICLEPEAACLSVAHGDARPWEAGTKLMILDCGGGTVDITTHEVVDAEPLSLQELEEPTGGPWGSTTVDAKVKQFLKELLQCTDKQWDTLAGSSHMLDLLSNWEERKTNYEKGRTVRLQLGDVLDQIGMAVDTFQTVVAEFDLEGTRATSSGRVLRIKPALISTFFESTFEEIVRAVKKTLADQPSIAVVYLVGGFSSSFLLQEAVSSGLSGHGDVRMVPVHRPGLAIVMGAALFGASKRPIVSRKARLTYGIRACCRYDKDEPEHCQRKKNVALAKGTMHLDVFKQFVERGEDLLIGTDKEHTFIPLTENQSKVSFEITVSSRPGKDIKYLKDDGVENMLNDLITVEVPLDMSVPWAQRGVSIRLTFGGTELGATAKRLSDCEKVTTTTVYIEEVVEDSNRAVVF